MEHEPVGTTTTRHSAASASLRSLAGGLASRAWSKACFEHRNRPHARPFSIATHRLYHLRPVLSITYTGTVHSSIHRGQRKMVRHEDMRAAPECLPSGQPQRWTLIPRWSRQRAVGGGVIGLLVVMAVMGDEHLHRLGGGVWWRRR
jgi:hypothetical protein